MSVTLQMAIVRSMVASSWSPAPPTHGEERCGPGNVEKIAAVSGVTLGLDHTTVCYFHGNPDNPHLYPPVWLSYHLSASQ